VYRPVSSGKAAFRRVIQTRPTDLLEVACQLHHAAGSARSHRAVGRPVAHRLSADTSQPTKISELYAFVIIVVGILAAAAIKGSGQPRHASVHPKAGAAVPLIVSHGLAKSDNRDHYSAGTPDRHEYYSVIVREIEIER
jgi:hypothetical protein